VISLKEIVSTQNMVLFEQYCVDLTFDEVREHGRLLRVNMDFLESMIRALECDS